MRSRDGDPQPVRQLRGRLSATATSQRLMNTDATDPTAGLSPARSGARCRVAGLRRCQILLAREQQRDVDREPAKVASSMAGRPSVVPGILMNRLGLRPGHEVPWRRPGSRRCRGPTAAKPPAKPSRRRHRSTRKSGLNKSAARVRSSSARSKNRSSTDRRLRPAADRGIIGSAVFDGMVEDVGFEVSPVTENSSM